MRTLDNTDIWGFGTHDATRRPAAWRATPPARRANEIHPPASARVAFPSASEASASLAQASGTSLVADDDFPFSALIRLVRQMRE